MKIAILAILFTIFVAVNARNICNSDEDCEEDECCVYGLFLSKCQKKPGVGEYCNEGMMGKKHLLHCSCSDDLECKPEYTIFNIKYKDRCVAKSTEAPTTTVGQ